MEIYNDLNKLPKFKNAVVTIGSFDGVHKGHQTILERVKSLARKVGGESVVITFHPHPRLVLFPKDNTLRLINTIDEKVKLLERYGIDKVVVVPFTVEFGEQSADEYIEKFLVGKFNPAHIVIGYDHRFGKNRQGDIHFLKHHADKHGFQVDEITKQEVQEITVSSTQVRKALESGQVGTAANLLGHYFSLTGTVVSGQRIGTNIGFPTANLEIRQQHKLVPPFGIYAVYVHHKGRRYKGMLYIGDRPTLPHLNDKTIEVNIFDFQKDIYGDKIQLELVEFIRSDAPFDGLEALSQQLALDKQSALAVFDRIEKAENLEVSKLELPTVAVVILNYNGQEWLEKMMPSVTKHRQKDQRIIVADNGSTDDSLAWLKAHFPRVEIIDLKENYGFAGGYNRALEQVDASILVLLNSDVEVTENWLNPVLETLQKDETIGIAQPKIKAWHQKTHFEYAGAAGGWLDYLGYPFSKGRIFNTLEEDKGQYTNNDSIFWASGAAFFIRKELFTALGGFDEHYFAHWEEIDLCWRAKRAGYRVVTVPKSEVYHVGGGTLGYMSPRKTYLNFRNNLFTLLKNERRRKLLWLIPSRLVLDGLAGGLFLVQGKWRHIGAIIKAHFHFYRDLKKVLIRRGIDRDRINKISISHQMNVDGWWRGSIIWQYYFRGRKKFQQLPIHEKD